MKNKFWLLAFVLAFAIGAHAQTKIGAVQGAGDTSPLAGQNVVITGVVTGDFQREDQLGGFFLQDEGDGDAATSDGIFVYAPLRRAGTTDVQSGQRLSVRGVAEEFGGQTQIGLPQIRILGNAALAKPLELAWPLPKDVLAERYEGMLITLPQTMTVTGNYELARFGALTLSANGRLMNAGNAEGDMATRRTMRVMNRRRVLLLDDGNSKRNPKPVPYLDAQGTRRAGDIVKNLTGILSQGWEAYRLHPTIAPHFETQNARPAVPEVGGTLKVASFNLHNYFTTLRRGNNEARGAESEAALKRQTAKLLAAIKAMNPDILACNEVENSDAAVQTFLHKLNEAMGGAYAAVQTPAVGLGEDAIRVALFYKAEKLSPRGATLADTDAIFDRPPLAQTFLQPNGVVFSIVVNHFKSKGGCPETGDVDEGEGCWNQRRTAQAQRLLAFVEKLKAASPHVLVTGDFNAYFNEMPLRALRDGGLSSPKQSASDYSFIFDGEAGSLDHAFVTPSLSPLITGVAAWHINADEPSFLDYAENTSPADVYRSSDHDPLLIGLDFSKP
jgi:uncharacterized protein